VNRENLRRLPLSLLQRCRNLEDAVRGFDAALSVVEAAASGVEADTSGVEASYSGVEPPASGVGATARRFDNATSVCREMLKARNRRMSYNHSITPCPEIRLYIEKNPPFEPPSDPNQTIWHFCQFESLASILLSRKLFFTRLDAFNDDKYEGWSTDATIAELRPAPDSGWVSGSDVAQIERDRFGRQTLAASCWQMNNSESLSMWAQYAPGKAGVAIRSTYLKLKECCRYSRDRLVSGERDLRVFIGCMKYCDPRVDKDLRGSPYRPAIWKPAGFKDECELRAIISFPRWTGKGKPATVLQNESQYLDIDPKVLVDCIVVSPHAPAWLVNTTNLLLDRVGLGQVAVPSDLLKGPAYLEPG